ncbi:MAG: universal stress protein [Phormidesmis sp. FL-bin-119]|nr:universal stress protein [Pedobacter sp.]
METLNILIPTDFSVQAEYAYLMVKKLDEKIPIRTHFLHVLQVPDTVTMDADGNIQTCGEIDVNYVLKQKEIAERKLANLKSMYGEHIETHLVLGKTTDAILNFSAKMEFDLIVMGTKGSWGIMESLSGSETQMVARKSKTPVLSLMCDRSDLQIRNILLVHNFSQPVKENTTLLHKLIRAFNIKIHMLQISTTKSHIDQDEIATNMKRFAELNDISNYECHYLNDKDLESGVVHYNQMHEMDIICIGAHVKAGVFQGSETEKLINHLFKPILSFQFNSAIKS